MTLCCHLHKPGRCCDPEDCSPCCARCPDACPLDVGKRGKPDFDYPQLPGFAAAVVNKMAGVSFDCAVRFEDADPSDYVYRVRNPDKMIFTVEHFDEEKNRTVTDAVYEMSIRKLS